VDCIDKKAVKWLPDTNWTDLSLTWSDPVLTERSGSGAKGLVGRRLKGRPGVKEEELARIVIGIVKPMNGAAGDPERVSFHSYVPVISVRVREPDRCPGFHTERRWI